MMSVEGRNFKLVVSFHKNMIFLRKEMKRVRVCKD